MKSKEKIIMVILIKEMKGQITISMLKEWIREKYQMKIIQKEDFKATILDLIVHMEIKMIKKEDIKTEEDKILTEKMVISNSKKTIDALIVKKRVTLQENARSLQGKTIETWEEDITLIEVMVILKVIVKTIEIHNQNKCFSYNFQNK